MSEIYNGTFLLGNTSATTLSAGPGIKIDSTSVPGTIKISNDETVLWENTAWLGKDVTPGANSATLNESIFNFDYVKVYAARTVLTASPLPSTIVNEYETNVVSGQSGQCLLYGFFVSQSNTPFDAWTLLKFNNGIGVSEVSGGQKPLTGSIDTGHIYYHPYKIVGINRISGGN